MEIEDFKKFLLLYIVFEGNLFDFANPERGETNIFCTPLIKTDFRAVGEFINAKTIAALRPAFTRVCHTIQKYSALNPNHLYDYGTVEFRHLRGDRDPTQLGDWINIIARLYVTAQQISMEQLEEELMSLNTTSDYRKFTESVFGVGLAAQILGRRHREVMSNGVTIAKQIFSPPPKVTTVIAADSGLAVFAESLVKKSQPDPLKLKKSPEQQAEELARQQQQLQAAREQFDALRQRETGGLRFDPRPRAAVDMNFAIPTPGEMVIVDEVVPDLDAQAFNERHREHEERLAEELQRIRERYVFQPGEWATTTTTTATTATAGPITVAQPPRPRPTRPAGRR